jgi:hypothetical protein
MAKPLEECSSSKEERKRNMIASLIFIVSKIQ